MIESGESGESGLARGESFLVFTKGPNHAQNVKKSPS